MPFHISKPSTQSLYLEVRSRGVPIGTATGFVVENAVGRCFLVTNRHVVTGRHQDTGTLLDTKTCAVPDEIVVWHNSTAEIGQYTLVHVPLFVNEVRSWIEHPVLGSAADFVALSIVHLDGIRLCPYRLNYHEHLRMHPAQRISVVGFPFGERTGRSFAIWATGFVASEPEIDHGGLPVFLIDCRTSSGQSGSPVIFHEEIGAFDIPNEGANETVSESRLLGVYSGRINAESDIGRVWKAYSVAELVDSN